VLEVGGNKFGHSDEFDCYRQKYQILFHPPVFAMKMFLTAATALSHASTNTIYFQQMRRGNREMIIILHFFHPYLSMLLLLETKKGKPSARAIEIFCQKQQRAN
jgi:hypothetical protein